LRSRPKILAGLLIALLAVGVTAFVQERNAHATLESLSASLAAGDSRDGVERIVREHGLQLKDHPDRRSVSIHVWFHFRPDVSVIVVLNADRKVEKVFIENLAE
jgi:hypothetical protein